MTAREKCQREMMEVIQNQLEQVRSEARNGGMTAFNYQTRLYALLSSIEADLGINVY